MRKYFVILASVTLALVWFIGCDDRSTGITRTDLGEAAGGGAWAAAETPMVPHLSLQLRNPGEELYGTAYLPPEATAIPVQQPIPLLILLAPEGGTKWHYFKAGLDELVKDLTASGKIQPMAIYCVGNDQTFGGYFYGENGGWPPQTAKLFRINAADGQLEELYDYGQSITSCATHIIAHGKVFSGDLWLDRTVVTKIAESSKADWPGPFGDPQTNQMAAPGEPNARLVPIQEVSDDHLKSN